MKTPEIKNGNIGQKWVMGRRQNVLGQLSGFSLLRGEGVQRNLLNFAIEGVSWETSTFMVDASK